MYSYYKYKTKYLELKERHVYLWFMDFLLYLIINMSKYKKTLKIILKTINNDPLLKSVFYSKTKNRKYVINKNL